MAELWIAAEEEFPPINDSDDRVYEEIEAPKFVDFSAPDPSRPDDASWFCARIGCDQKHEEIDPDSIYKNFVLRVMAARSPNIRKLCQHVQRCPRTEPVKCVNDHRLRFAEKIGNARLNAHPISFLSSTPHVKEKYNKASNAVKDMATPRSKKHPANETVPSAISKINKLRKPIVPNKVWEKSTISSNSILHKTRICSDTEKVKSASQSKRVREHQQPSKSQKGLQGVRSNSKITSSPLKPCMLIEKKEENVNCHEHQERNINPSRMEVEEKIRRSSENENPEVENNMYAQITKEGNAGKNSSRNSLIYDDKENDAAIYTDRDRSNIENENTNPNTCNNSLCKAKDTSGKFYHDKSVQGAKLKKMKPTNPKPFRFRTDERGILKEANHEKRIQLDPVKELKAPHSISSDEQAVSRSIVTNRRKMVENNGTSNAKPKSQSSQRDTMRAKISDKSRVIRRVVKPDGKEGAQLVTPLRVRKATTVPKEPVFHEMHVPKSCTKRPQKPMS